LYEVFKIRDFIFTVRSLETTDNGVQRFYFHSP
jgi:hypothetical protein